MPLSNNLLFRWKSILYSACSFLPSGLRLRSEVPRGGHIARILHTFLLQGYSLHLLHPDLASATSQGSEMFSIQGKGRSWQVKLYLFRGWAFPYIRLFPKVSFSSRKWIYEINEAASLDLQNVTSNHWNHVCCLNLRSLWEGVWKLLTCYAAYMRIAIISFLSGYAPDAFLPIFILCVCVKLESK